MAQNTDSGYKKLETLAPAAGGTSTDVQPQQPLGGANQPQAMPATTQPPPISSQPKPREIYKDTLYRLGIVEAVFGVLSIIFCIVTLILAAKNSSYQYWDQYDRRYYSNRISYGSNVVAQGIWCGTGILASGILGIKARSYPSVCMYRANMTVSILASVLMGIQCILSGISTVTVYPDKFVYVLLPYHIILAIIGFIGMIICIIHSAYCCAGVCCRRKPYRGVPMRAGPGFSQQQMVRLANGQYVMVQNYPVIAQPAVAVRPGQVIPQPAMGVSPYPAGSQPYYPPGQMPAQPPSVMITSGQMHPSQPPSGVLSAPMYSQQQPTIPVANTAAPSAPYPTMPQQVMQPSPNSPPPAYPTQPPYNPSV